MEHLPSNTTLQSGKYRIEQLLGQGGFGITYLAEQCLLKKKVAIKEFFIRDLCFRDDKAGVRSVTQTDMVDRYRQKFFKEAQILARLNHPGIVRVIDIFEENGTVYYVMDYVEGESLAEIIKRKGALPEQTALQYIYKVAEALEYIHKSNVNHLDVKPANIMIRHDDNEPILIDFGVSKQYDEQKDQTTTTPPGVSNGYSPLEQYRPGGIGSFSPQADVYALGATLYMLLTGQTPPNAHDVLIDGIPSLPDSISSNVREAIEAAMQPRSIDRPESIGAFKQMLGISETEDTVIPQSGSEEDTQITGDEGLEEETFGKTVRKHVLKAILYSVVGALLIVLAGYSIYNYIQIRKAKQHELFVRDSIAQVRKNEQARLDSLNQVRTDSIEQAKKDSIEQKQLMEERQKELKRMVEAYSHKIDEFINDNNLYGYFLYDITQDGLPELWVKTGTCEADFKLDVFSYNHGIKKIHQEEAGHCSYCQGNNYILVWFNHMGTAEWNKITYNNTNGKIKSKRIFRETLKEDETVDDYTKPKEPFIGMYYDTQPIYNLLSFNNQR